MTITTINVKDISMTNEEYEHLCATETILEEIFNSFGNFTKLVNPTTGETILMNELPRVRGILSALVENEKWEVNLV